MDAYLSFMDNVSAEGPVRYELFVVPDAKRAKYEMQTLFDLAAGRGLDVSVNSNSNTVRIPDGIAYFRVAYPEMSIRLAGMAWHAVHGLEHFDKWPDTAEADRARVLANIRWAK